MFCTGFADALSAMALLYFLHHSWQTAHLLVCNGIDTFRLHLDGRFRGQRVRRHLRDQCRPAGYVILLLVRPWYRAGPHLSLPSRPNSPMQRHIIADKFTHSFT